MAEPHRHRQSRTAREALFEHLVPGRECGECLVCCKDLGIEDPALSKPIGQLCPHHTGGGCGIYAHRPQLCRTWHCLWRRIDAMPDALRPDRLGVVFSIERQDPPCDLFERLFIVARALDGADAFARPPVRATLDMFAHEGSLPVWTSVEGTRELYFPDFALADAIRRPNATPWQSLAVRALAWRRNYRFTQE